MYINIYIYDICTLWNSGVHSTKHGMKAPIKLHNLKRSVDSSPWIYMNLPTKVNYISLALQCSHETLMISLMCCIGLLVVHHFTCTELRVVSAAESPELHDNSQHPAWLWEAGNSTGTFNALCFIAVTKKNHKTQPPAHFFEEASQSILPRF